MPATRSTQIRDDSDSSVQSENTTKRRRNSPQKTKNTTKKHKAVMNVEQLQQQNESILKKLQLLDLLQPLSDSVAVLSNKIDDIGREQKTTNKRVRKLETGHSKLEEAVENLQIAQNQLDQKQLAKHFIISGLPSFENSKRAETIRALSTHTGVKFDEGDVKTSTPFPYAAIRRNAPFMESSIAKG
jgi:hypothetical protein